MSCSLTGIAAPCIYSFSHAQCTHIKLSAVTDLGGHGPVAEDVIFGFDDIFCSRESPPFLT